MNHLANNAKLNHMSFPTKDVAATASFFVKYLGFTVSMKDEPNFCILKRPGFDVVIERAARNAPTTPLTPSNEARGAFNDCVGDELRWPRAFHIGFELPKLEDVRELRDALAADGFEAETDIFNNDRGSRFFLRAPGGVLFEFNTRSDAAAEFRGTFDN